MRQEAYTVPLAITLFKAEVLFSSGVARSGVTTFIRLVVDYSNRSEWHLVGSHKLNQLRKPGMPDAGTFAITKFECLTNSTEPYSQED